MAERIQCSFERYEKKYLITPDQQARILSAARPYMKEDEYGRYSICNVYYDTDDFSLIRASLEKPVYKEKLRVRSYGVPADDDRVFVEIKKKCGGVVYKRRVVMMAMDAPGYLSGDAALSPGGQISREIDYFQSFHRTAPQVFIGYDRTAMGGIENEALRVTFDTNIRWRDSMLDLRSGDGGMLILPQDTVLMEIKIPGAMPLWLTRLLSSMSVFPTSFSKYGECYRNNILNRKELLFSA